MGWSGTDRHGLSQGLFNYDDPALVEAGLVIESEDGRRYDRFRERVMFPIRNARGSLIGFGGRIIGRGEPKYLNSPETPLFSRDRSCTACGRPARPGRKARSSWSGGYMDVVGLAQQGIANAVATLGTATTPDHVKSCCAPATRSSSASTATAQTAARPALRAGLPAGAAR